MKRLRRISLLILLALAILLSSVILFEGRAHAQPQPEVNIDTPISPLRSYEPVLEETSVRVMQKSNELSRIGSEFEEIEKKKESLLGEVETLKKELEEVAQQIEEKKARVAAEKKRVEELRDMFVHVNRYAQDSPGNAYVAGNCTWYVKDRRPDIGNFWGNANMWYSNAQAQGWNVGHKPKKGAVATTTSGPYGHVAYVEKVSLDGLWVTISEMNAPILGNITSRTVLASEFSYIYELD